MNAAELTKKVRAAVDAQCKSRGFAAPVDVLLDIGVLSEKQYTDWRFGRVPYLEKVCHANMNQLALILGTIRTCAAERGYRASFTGYRQWGGKGARPLRFSKSGDARIEQSYATHYLAGHRTSDES